MVSSSITTINTLNNDCLRKVFSFLSLNDLITTSQVNQRWRKITRDSRFLNLQFPSLKTDSIPLQTTHGFVALANAYRQMADQVQDMKKLSLKKCSAMTDAALKLLNIRTSSLSIKHCPRITMEGLENVFTNLISPARIRIAEGTSIFTYELFSECIERKIHLQKLDIRKASKVFNVSKNFVGKKFSMLIEKNLLQTPCHLDLRNEFWVGNHVFDSLKKAQSAAFSFLGLSFHDDTLLEGYEKYNDLISALNFTRPCDIRTNLKLNDHMLRVIIEKNLLLKSLKLDLGINPHLLTTIFESHLFSTCSLKLPADILTSELVEILIRKKITLEQLHFKSEVNTYSDDHLIALSALFQNVPIKAFNIECDIALPLGIDRFVNCLLQLKDNPGPPNSIAIRHNGLTKKHFISLSKAGIFKGRDFSLKIEGEWIDTSVIDSLADVKDLAFKKFQLTKNWNYFYLNSLLHKNSFSNCVAFLSGHCGLEFETLCLPLHSKSPIKKLHVSLGAWRERTCDFLLNPKSFRNLHTLVVSDITDQDFKDFAVNILKVRPNLFLRHISSKQPVIEEPLEVD